MSTSGIRDKLSPIASILIMLSIYSHFGNLNILFSALFISLNAKPFRAG